MGPKTAGLNCVHGHAGGGGGLGGGYSTVCYSRSRAQIYFPAVRRRKAQMHRGAQMHGAPSAWSQGSVPLQLIAQYPGVAVIASWCFKGWWVDWVAVVCAPCGRRGPALAVRLAPRRTTSLHPRHYFTAAPPGTRPPKFLEAQHHHGHLRSPRKQRRSSTSTSQPAGASWLTDPMPFASE